mgnify:CR=1 FL=1
MNSTKKASTSILPLGVGLTIALMVFGLLLSLPVAAALLGNFTPLPGSTGVTASVGAFLLICWICQSTMLGLMVFLNLKVQEYQVQIHDLGVIVVAIGELEVIAIMLSGGQFRPPQIVS